MSRARLAGLISGGGRTLMNLCDAIDRGDLDAEIPLVIASRPGLSGVERARRRGLDVRIAARSDFDSEDALHDATSQWIVEHDVDLVCLCGWLRWIRIDDALRGKVINIHPSLLPAFGGPGMFGMNVHRAVLEAKHSFSGCTVHYVDEVYDHGPVILQRPCPVLPDDDADALAARVFEQECTAFPEAIRGILAGHIALGDDRVVHSP